MKDVTGHIQSTLFHLETVENKLVARTPFYHPEIREFKNKLLEIGWTEGECFNFEQKESFRGLVSNMILQGSKNANKIGPTHILLRGEPSAGKTTELRRIAQQVLSSEEATHVVPVYTELQYSRTKSKMEITLWQDIASGCTNPEFEHLDEGESFDLFVESCKKMKRQPLFFIDTLDILLLQENVEHTTTAWGRFLQKATKSNVPIVWTCRPHEWKYFKPILEENVEQSIITIDLPPLNKQDLKAVSSSESDLENDESSHLEEWNDWTKELQANVPLFAHRKSLEQIDKKRLPYIFLSKLFNWFDEYMNLDLVALRKNPLDILNGSLPTSLYYRCLIDTISDTLSRNYDVKFSISKEFFRVFEGYVQNSVRQNKNVLRQVFSTLGLREELKNQDFDVLVLRDILNVSESHGLLEQNGLKFEFTHQLLLEEVLFKAQPNDDFLQFPSIQIRAHPSKIAEIVPSEYRENFDSLNHWIGGLLAYHPQVRDNNTNLLPAWDEWRNQVKSHDFYEGGDEDENSEGAMIVGAENTEKREILQRHITSTRSQALYLNGAPGTGKTFFCFYFLQHHLLNSRENLSWRYVTLSEPLVDHFERQWSQFKSGPESDNRLMVVDTTTDSTNRSLGGTSLEFLLSQFLNRLVKNPDINTPSGARFGLLTFRRFKERLSQYYSRLKTGQSAPATADAWHDYRDIWHHQSGKKRTESLDYLEVKPKSKMGLNKSEFKGFEKFIKEGLKNWKIIEEASYLATEQLGMMTDEDRSYWQHDVLMVDEIQDLSPPALSFLLCLNRRNFDSKSILIAGDRFQTVNRSGFEWDKFTGDTFTCLEQSGQWLENEHSNRIVGLLFNNGESVEIETLRTQYRNAPKITKFNDAMRASFGQHYGAMDEFDDYEGGSLILSNQVKENDQFAKVTLCICRSDEDLEGIARRLQAIETDITQTSNVAVITPYDHREEELFNGFKSFTVYDGESVKGLEFDGVVVLQPYELLSNEAASSIGLGGDRRQEAEESRIQKWFDSDGDEAEKMRKSFLGLYRNIRTRMNVVFSRPKYSLLVLLRDNLGAGPMEFNRDEFNSTRLFDLPDPSVIDPAWNKEIQLQTYYADRVTDDELRTALYLPDEVGDTSIEARIERAIQAEQMRDGSSMKNIITLWRNFIINIEVHSRTLPYRSACLLSGSVDLADSSNSPPTVLFALRGGVIDPSIQITNFVTSKSSACERVMYHLHRVSQQRGQQVQQVNTLHYSLYGNLYEDIPILLHEALYEASRAKMIAEYPQILGSLLSDLFGFELPSLPEDGQQELAISPEMSILLSEQLVRDNNGISIRIKPLSFNDFIGRFSDSNPEEIVLDETRSFDRILLSMLRSIGREKNAEFLDRCFKTIGGLRHLEIEETECVFWKLGATVEASQIEIVLAGITNFLPRKLELFSWHLHKIEQETRNPELVEDFNFDALHENKFPNSGINQLHDFWTHANLLTMKKNANLNDLISVEGFQRLENKLLPYAGVILMDSSTAFSNCLDHLSKLAKSLDSQQVKVVGKALYSLTWYCREKPSANVSRSLLLDWHASERTPRHYHHFVELWWDDIVAEMGLIRKIRVPKTYLDRVELLEMLEPIMDLLEIKAGTNPQHRPLQRTHLMSIVDTCYELTPASDQSLDVSMVGVLMKTVFGGDKKASFFDKYGLESIFRGFQNYAAKLAAIYGVTSLYSVSNEQLALTKSAKIELPNSTSVSPPSISSQERRFFTHHLKAMTGRVRENFSEQFMSFYRDYSNSYLDPDGPGWWNIKKRTPYWFITGDRITHWIRFVELNSLLQNPASNKELDSWKPHLFLPVSLNEINQEHPIQMEFLNDYSDRLKKKQSYQQAISSILSWLYCELPGEEIQGPIQVHDPSEVSMRTLLLRDYISAYGEQHYLDWHLLFLLSQSIKPNQRNSERSEHDLLEFNSVLDEMAASVVLNPEILDLYRDGDESLETWVKALELITSTMETDSLNQILDFVAMLTNPHVELLARYERSTMNKFTLSGRRTKNGFFTDHTRFDRKLIGQKGVVRKQYHRQMLKEFNTYLLKRGFEILGIDE
jgi:hypothetical protein